LCSKSKNGLKEDSNLLYYSSFETIHDLSQWERINEDNIISESCPDGGEYSIKISGGCLIPHASLTFEATGKDQYVVLDFFAKNLEIGGYVEIFIEGSNTSSSISINDKEWKRYYTLNCIFWPAEKDLTIWLYSGGYVPSAMLIDEFKLIKVR